MQSKPVFHSLTDALAALDQLAQSPDVQTTNWSAYRILQHCAQTIEYSMSGYPASKPKWFQLTVGKFVIGKFLKQGYMKHDLAAPVPGSPALTQEGSLQDGLRLLRAAIEKFQAYDRPLQPHLFFGTLTKAEYDRYFAMHIADHLSEVRY